MQTTIHLIDATIKANQGADMLPMIIRDLANLLRPCPECGHFTCMVHGSRSMSRFSDMIRDGDINNNDGILIDTEPVIAFPDDSRSLEMLFHIDAIGDGNAILKLNIRETTGRRNVVNRRQVPCTR